MKIISKRPKPLLAPPQKTTQQETESSGPNIPISSELEECLTWINDTFTSCADLVERQFHIGFLQKRAAVFYFDGMIDKTLLHQHILEPLIIASRVAEPDGEEVFRDFYQWIEKSVLTSGEIKTVETFNDMAKGIIQGDLVLFIDGCEQGLVIGAKGWAARGVTEPATEMVLRGPREAFNEVMRVNTSMLRRRLKTNKIKIEARQLGTMTKTNVAVAYLYGVSNHELVEEVHRRLDGIKEVDSILEGGCIEQYIEDSPYSPFPQIQYTERPDKVTAALLEGRIALIVDGTPDVLIMPAVFMQFLQSSEDYYNRIWAGTMQRWIRYLGVFIAITFPSLYVAITSYHQEMLPTNLAMSIVAAREGVPFPAFVEALIMEITFELLREASIRLPNAIGNAIGIVGALVIGQAAVEAKLVAPQMVIVVAITAIGSFTVPIFEASYPIRLVRFPLMFLAAALGLYGVMIGWIALLIHMISLRSFGFPYMEPLAPLRVSGLKDVLIRAPRWQMMTKPQFVEPTEAPPHSFWQRTFLHLFRKGRKE